MPHWIKQLVIALERSGIKPSTDLEFKGKKLSLAMLQAVWEKYCDEFGEMRTNRNTTEHYFKNSYNRMRVWLAAQVLSQTQIRLIDEHADKYGGKEEYGPLREVLEKVDRLIGICNNTDMSTQGEYKNCECLDSSTHCHINELIDIFIIFAEWKEVAGKDKKKFILWQSYQDLAWLVFGLIGLARTYLKEDKSRVVVQWRGGTDHCEHEFTRIEIPSQQHWIVGVMWQGKVDTEVDIGIFVLKTTHPVIM